MDNITKRNLTRSESSQDLPPVAMTQLPTSSDETSSEKPRVHSQPRTGSALRSETSVPFVSGSLDVLENVHTVFEHTPLLGYLKLRDLVRLCQVSPRAYYAVNMHLNPRKRKELKESVRMELCSLADTARKFRPAELYESRSDIESVINGKAKSQTKQIKEAVAGRLCIRLPMNMTTAKKNWKRQSVITRDWKLQKKVVRAATSGGEWRYLEIPVSQLKAGEFSGKLVNSLYTIKLGENANPQICLALDNSTINVNDGEALAKLLVENKAITKVSLRSITFEKGAYEAIANVLQFAHVTELTIDGSEMGENEQEIAFALGSASLRKLEIIGNSITDNGLEAFANALLKNKSLDELNLQNNHITCAGAESLARGLKENQSVDELYLQNNEIGGKGATALGKILAFNKSIRYFDISENCVGDDGAAAIVNGLSSNKCLLVLDLSKNKVKDNCVEAIAGVLSENDTLLRLELNDEKSEISDSVMKKLSHSLEANQTLRRLGLRRITISRNAQLYLADILTNKKDKFELHYRPQLDTLSTNSKDGKIVPVYTAYVTSKETKALQEAGKVNSQLTLKEY